MSNPVPLCVDMDGTLIQEDTLILCLISFFRKSTFKAVISSVSIVRGKALFKRIVSRPEYLELGKLTYHGRLCEFIRDQKSKGRRIILCTAADSAVAYKIAGHAGIFDEVIASNGIVNLKGKAKAAELVRRFGEKGFDYAGNDRADIAVWNCARRAIIVNASKRLLAQARRRYSNLLEL